MIKTVKSIYPKLKSRGINDPLVNNIEDRIVTWEILIENISNDLNNLNNSTEDDYDSVFRTFNEIRYIIIMNLSSETTSCLFKLCSLLWYHLQRIYGTHDI